jgi:hypothetical protein
LESKYPWSGVVETMNYWGHAITSNAAVIGMATITFLLGKPVWSVGLFLTFFMGFSFADSDLKLNAHRHWFFHSCIPCAMVAIIVLWIAFDPAMALEAARREAVGAAMFCVSQGMHLLCDLKLDEKGKRGTYLIYKRHGDRMGVKQTDGWLMYNAIGALLMALLLVAWG